MGVADLASIKRLAGAGVDEEQTGRALAIRINHKELFKDTLHHQKKLLFQKSRNRINVKDHQTPLIVYTFTLRYDAWVPHAPLKIIRALFCSLLAA